MQIGLVRLQRGAAPRDETGRALQFGGAIKHALGLLDRRPFPVERHRQPALLRFRRHDQCQNAVRRSPHPGPAVLQAEPLLRAGTSQRLRDLAGKRQQPLGLRAHPFRLARRRLIRGQAAQLTLHARPSLPDQRGHAPSHARVLVARGRNVPLLRGIEGCHRRADRIRLREIPAKMKLVGRERDDAFLLFDRDTGAPFARIGQRPEAVERRVRPRERLGRHRRIRVPACPPGRLPRQRRADAGVPAEQAAPERQRLRLAAVHAIVREFGVNRMPLSTLLDRRQPVLRRRQLVFAPRQQHTLRPVARGHAHQRVQDPALGIHQNEITQLPDRLDRERGGAVLGMLKTEEKNAFETHRQLDSFQPCAPHVFAQQQKQRRLLGDAPSRLMLKQMNATGLRMRRQQQVAPLLVSVDLQRNAAAVGQDHLLHTAARNRLSQFAGHRRQCQRVKMHTRRCVRSSAVS